MKFSWLSRSGAVGLLMVVSQAQADGMKADRLQSLAQKLASTETQLSPEDRRAIEHHLDSVDFILSRYQTTTSLTCLSNGESGAYERFKITEPATGTVYGKVTGLPTCKQLIAVQSQGLLCVSNGEQGVYEKFGLYDVGLKAVKGGYTSLKTCQALVGRAKTGFMCQSNGEAGVYEKFHLFNRLTEKQLGGDTQLAQCLNSIPE